tara:strand:+ start:1065 stop:2024 length:960 start_codon:yes stop_codon:yes gene_type:complete
MANKKISQLVGIGTSSTVSGTFLLPVGAGSSTGPYTTNKITTSELASYIFTGDSGGGGFPAAALSGQKDVYFNNPNYQNTTAAADGVDYAYLMLKTSNGLLTTGSGIARPVGGDNLGNHTATTTLNMQDNIINNVGQSINFQDGGNVGSTASEISIAHGTKIRLDAPTVQLGDADNVTVNGSFSARSADFAGAITGDSLEVQGASYHNVTALSSNTIDWRDGNIQHRTINQNTSMTFQANTLKEGQTLTLYVENSDTDPHTIYFRSGANTGNVLFPPMPESVKHVVNSTPGISGRKTNVYTFVNIHTGIFASSVTGYVY